MTEILAKAQVANTPLNPTTLEPQGFAQFPYSSSIAPQTIADLEQRATELRTNYRIVSEALFEFGDQLIQLKQKVKKAGLKWSEWSKFYFPDLDKQLKDAMAIAKVWRELWEDDYALIEKMKGWGTPVIAPICRGGLEIVKRFLSENDNPLAWTVKAAKALVREWKGLSSKGPGKQTSPKTKSTVQLVAIDKAIAELSHLRSMKQTLAEELEASVTTEVRDRLKLQLHQTELKIESALTQLMALPVTAPSESNVTGEANPTANLFESQKLEYEQRIATLEQALAQSQQPATAIDSDSELARTNRLKEKLRQDNLLLTERLEQLQAALEMQTQQPSIVSPEVSDREQHYQLQLEALQAQLEQQRQENARLVQHLQKQNRENQRSSSEDWSQEKQALEQRIVELEQALSERATVASAKPSSPHFSPNCIVRIVNSGNGSIVGHLGRYLGEGTAINKLGDPYPVAEVLLEEGSKYEKTVNVPNWTENLELVNLTLEEHQRVVAARYAVLEKKYLQEEVQQLNEQLKELKTTYSVEAIAADLGRMLAPAIGADKVQELVATSENGLKAIGRYLRELLMEPAF